MAAGQLAVSRRERSAHIWVPRGSALPLCGEPPIVAENFNQRRPVTRVLTGISTRWPVFSLWLWSRPVEKRQAASVETYTSRRGPMTLLPFFCPAAAGLAPQMNGRHKSATLLSLITATPYIKYLNEGRFPRRHPNKPIKGSRGKVPTEIRTPVL